MYIRDWEYGTHPCLVQDLGLPHWFDRSSETLRRTSYGMEGPPSKWRWLYIGEAGSGSATHTDPLDSAAWLFCVRGRKRWRAVHAGDLSLVVPSGREELPDLFAPDSKKFPGLKSARLYEGASQPGGFSPSLGMPCRISRGR